MYISFLLYLLSLSNSRVWRYFYEQTVQIERNRSRLGWNGNFSMHLDSPTLPELDIRPTSFEDPMATPDSPSTLDNLDAHLSCCLHQHLFALRHASPAFFPYHTYISKTLETPLEHYRTLASKTPMVKSYRHRYADLIALSKRWANNMCIRNERTSLL